MKQLRAILWKNFRWCVRHPIKCLSIYILPALLLWMLNKAAPRGDRLGYMLPCEHTSVPLPPTHPALLSMFLTCGNLDLCPSAGWYRFFDFTAPHDYPQWLTENYTCPNGNGYMGSMLDSACANVGVGRRSALQRLLYRGEIVYYPRNTQTDKVMDRMADYLDVLGELATEGMTANESLSAVTERETNLTGAYSGYEWRTHQLRGRPGVDAPTLEMMVTNSSNLLVALSLAATCYRPLRNRTIRLDSREQAEQFLLDRREQGGEWIWGMIEFVDTGADFSYKIISHTNTRAELNAVYLQAMAETAIIHHLTGSAPHAHLQSKLMPLRCAKNTTVFDAFLVLVIVQLTFALMPIVYVVASQMCDDKALGLQELLFIAGVGRLTVKLAWLVYGAALVLPACLAVGVAIKWLLLPLIEHTSYVLMMVFVSLFGLALLCQSVMVASAVSTAPKAGSLAMLGIAAAAVLPYALDMVPTVGYEAGRVGRVRLLSLLHPCVGVQIGMSYVFALEREGNAVNWANLAKSTVGNDQFGGMFEVLLHFLLQCAGFTLLSLYFDRVMPSKYGMTLPFYFPLLPSYWTSGQVDSSGADENFVNDKTDTHPDIEALDEQRPIGISIENLSKKFRGMTAVKGLSINFYQSEVTALLGHNGAGKTTTINMLTGMVSPSKGTAIVHGNDIRHQMGVIRRSLGYCPQYDIIYPSLSVRDHMSFYGAIKGIAKAHVQSYSDAVFKQIGLDSAVNQSKAAKSLSGGMKRKLSIAMAFLGSPATVILDEPTSAIDPFSRRAIWDLIQQHRSASTILITTHNMQEADMIGDRIAIMNGGRLKCFGTPMYLKSRYGAGCSIIVAHTGRLDALRLEAQLQQHIPARLAVHNGTQANYKVPLRAARSPELIAAFLMLEDSDLQQDVLSYGISESTMEQVFLTVASDDPGEVLDVDAEPAIKVERELIADSAYSTGVSLMLGQFVAMWIKRVQTARRSLIILLLQVFFPVLFSCLFLLLNGVSVNSLFGIEAEPWNSTLLMTPWNNTDQVDFFYTRQSNLTLSESVLEKGFGWRCSQSADASCTAAGNAWPETVVNDDTMSLCDCNCSGAVGDLEYYQAPKITVASGDGLIDLSGRNATNYLLNSLEASVIGGVEELAPVGKVQVPLIEKLPQVGALFDFARESTPVRVLWAGARPRIWGSPTTFETAMRYMRSTFLNAYNNIVLKSTSGWNGQSITLYTEEMSFTSNAFEQFVSVVNQIVTGIFFSATISLGLTIPICVIFNGTIKERVSGNRQLFWLMGLYKPVYWLANFVFDFGLYSLSVALVILLLNSFPEYFQLNLGLFVHVALLFGLGCTVCCYVMSFFFSRVAFAALLMYVIGFLAPFSFAIFEYIIPVMAQYATADEIRVENTTAFKAALFGLNMLPHYFLTSTLLQEQMINLPNRFSNQTLISTDELLEWDAEGHRVGAAIAFVALMLAALVLIESELLAGLFDTIGMKKKPVAPNAVDVEGGGMPQPTVADADVAAEDAAVMGGERDGEDTALSIKRVAKVFRGKCAVNDVSFGVQRGECFGLLGVNGAGKSTLLKMLTGYVKPTSGAAEVLGLNVFKQKAAAGQHMSYCPQDNVLLGGLTPPEHLYFYARVRGVPLAQQADLVDGLIADLGLSAHKHKQSRALSGGNQRKLNFAISLIGRPSVLFVDEMTSGLDPKARRTAWDRLLDAVRRRRCSAVITSHSMEECESLCNRLVIMVNGRFRCIGGVQYLKDKFGNNYNVKLRVDGPTEQLHWKLIEALPTARLMESRRCYLEVEVPSSGDMKLSTLFTVIHRLKAEFAIEEFSVTQISLEHIFIHMVRDQN